MSKFDIKKLTLWAAFFDTPSEEEIQATANTMKGGRAYLFKDADGLLVMRNRRRLNDFEIKRETFVRKVPVTA